MKTLTITEVKNGWVVKDISSGMNCFTDNASECSVYQTIEQLQKALPDLLAPTTQEAVKEEKITY